jgi:DNA-binding response OmpR family regulator
MPDAVKRILCVEDDRDSREMLKVMLDRSDPTFEVTTVGTAAEAIELSMRSDFDLYVLDIWLPGMDGLSLCRRLRDRGVKSPIIFFTAMVRTEDKDYALKAGADAFLVKPKDIEIFTDTVRDLLQQSATAGSV